MSIVDKIWINDLYNMVTDEIDKLSDPDNKIRKLAFIDEFNNSQISKILNIPRTTVSYRKKIIQKHLQ